MLDLTTFNFGNLMNDKGVAEYLLERVNLISKFHEIISTKKMPKPVLFNIM